MGADLGKGINFLVFIEITMDGIDFHLLCCAFNRNDEMGTAVGYRKCGEGRIWSRLEGELKSYEKGWLDKGPQKYSVPSPSPHCSSSTSAVIRLLLDAFVRRH